MAKISHSDLEKIKKSFSEEKKEQALVEKSLIAPSKKIQLEEARRNSRLIKLAETGMTKKQEILSRKAASKLLKSNFAQKKQPRLLQLSFGKGDVICFKFKNKKEIGVVIEIIEITKNKKIKKIDPKYSKKVKLVSSAGVIDVYAINVIEKVECNY